VHAVPHDDARVIAVVVTFNRLVRTLIERLERVPELTAPYLVTRRAGAAA
jgi:hypothetical protein